MKRVALRRGQPPVRRTMLRPARRRPVELDEGRALVLARAGGRCEVCRLSAAVHVHHVRRRWKGHDHSPRNLVAVCAGCHRWIHNNPLLASEAGWLELRGDVGPRPLP